MTRVWAVAWMAALAVGCGAGPVTTQDEEPPGQDVADDTQCQGDADCDDGVFCNGWERCVSGECREGASPCGDRLCSESEGLCVEVDSPEPEPEPVPTDMERLRQACPSSTDDEILDLVVTIEVNAWQAGLTLGNVYAEHIEFCGADQACALCLDTIAEYVYLDLHAGETPPAPPIIIPPIVTESALIAANGQFLGNVNDNVFDPDSLANSFGTYGSTFNPLSIWNQFGTYGSSFNSLSPWNAFSTTPPCIWESGSCVSFVTTNSFIQPSIHPNDLALAVGRTDVLR